MNATYRLRICYAKQGRGAHLSHLEVIRALERIVRRAGLPFATSQGFSPHMKASFGPALAVGTASQSEYFDVTLSEFVDPQVALTRLRDAAPAVLPIRNCEYVSSKEPSLSSAVTIFEYQVHLANSVTLVDETPQEIELDQKGKTKRFDVAVVLPKGYVVTRGDDETHVAFTVRATESGALRSDAFIDYLLELSDVSAPLYTIERTATLIEEKDGTWRTPLPA